MFRVCEGSDLILASSSPRRRELLEGCGLRFRIVKPDTDEVVLDRETPEQMVRRLAIEKARAVAGANSGSWVLAADTTVTIDGAILGKPADQADARRMLGMLQGRWHEVWGGYALLNRALDREAAWTCGTRVKMAAMNERAVQLYVHSGEPMDKAGAYAIQGSGTFLVEAIDGSYTNVVGLDLAAVISAMSGMKVIEVV